MADLGVDPSELDGGDKPKTKAKILPAATRGKGNPISDDDFQKLVRDWALDATTYRDEFLSVSRYNATEYYKGFLPDVDEDTVDEDRSTAVLTEVRDTVLGIMPELLRIFFSSESPVKFEPVAAQDAQQFQQNTLFARQATDYIRQVVLKVDNPDFFMTCHDVFQDALVRKTGFIKWWNEHTRKPEYSTHEGLTQQEALTLLTDPEVELVSADTYPAPGASPMAQPNPAGPATGGPAQPEMLYDCRIKRVRRTGRLRVRGIPCENVIVARRAVNMETRCTLFGYAEEKAVGDFLAEGWVDDPEELADCDYDAADEENLEAAARRPDQVSPASNEDDPPEDPTQRMVKFAELYITADRDGDGIPELIRVIAAGTNYKILDEEPVDAINWAPFCPYPEAHAFFGESVADLTKDIQRIKSRILRDTLDSLAQSVEPQRAVVEGRVNLDDVLNADTSKVIRTQAPGMIEDLKLPFVGADSMPVLDFMTKVREERTGVTNASNGLDPSVLQSSTKEGVMATLTKAQSRVEMIARIFAEVGFTRLFRGLLRELVKSPDGARMAILNKQPVVIDPRQWNAEMAVTVTLSLGRGDTAQQLQTLTAILGKQEQIIMELGPDNAIANMDQYCYTLARLVETAGWSNTASFFGDTSTLPPDQKAQVVQAMKQQAAQKAQAGKSGPDPQIEMAKIQSNEKIEMMKHVAENMKFSAQQQLEALKVKGELMVSAMQVLADHMNAQNETQVKALVDHFSNQMDAQVAHHGNMVDAAVAHHGNQMKADTQMQIAQMQPTPAAGGGG